MTITTETVILNSIEDDANKFTIPADIKLYKKRWLILVCFNTLAFSNLIQNMQYAVVADVIKDYYYVPYVAIDWTVMLESSFFLIFSFPLSYILDKLGLRKAIIIGTIGTAIGTWIKLLSINPNNFWVVFIGHGTITFFRMCFVLIIPKIASTWFGHKQIALATGLSFAGFECGNSLSFLIPSLLVVQGVESDITRSLYINNIIYIVISTLMVPIAIFFFLDKPKLPPSYAQKNYLSTKEASSINFLQECKGIFSNKNFLLFVLINSVSNGSIAATANLLNQIILNYFPDAGLHVGIVGGLHVLCSLLGAITSSLLLDRYKKFRIAAYLIYGSLLATLVMFSTTLHLGLPFVYITFMMMGACFGASLTTHMEIISELTYPQSQNVIVGFSGSCDQLATIILTSLYGYILRGSGSGWANITILTIVSCADLSFLFLRFNLRRTAQQIEMSNRANICENEVFLNK